MAGRDSDVYGHLVLGANKAAVDRLDEQAAQALEAAMGQREAVGAQAVEEQIERTAAPWTISTLAVPSRLDW